MHRNRQNGKRQSVQKRKEDARKRSDAKGSRLRRPGPPPLLQKLKRKLRPNPPLRNRSCPFFAVSVELTY